jgi:WD40 repeat protein/predicted Ser/Thr protein kinase
MTPERWQQVGTIFNAAVELETGARALYLAEVCGDDAALRQEVESLLAARDRPVGIMDEPPLVNCELAGREIGHYRVLARIGAGGMGEVYAAEDTELRRKVALKLLHAALTGDARQVSRLEKEAQAASALNHPNIITIHSTGQAEGFRFIVMEFIQGETLRHQMRGSRMPVPEALRVAVQVVGALAAAHKAGIVHRDIKPENVMVRDDGYVKVLDFGIAQLKDTQPCPPEPAAMPARVVTASAFLGTVSYMSPEQARREPLDTRTDLFSFGVLLYELLTGRRPFEGDTQAEVLRAICQDEPRPLNRPDVPRTLEEVVGKLLRKSRDERYQTAGKLLKDLKRLRRRAPLEEQGPAPAPERAGPTRARAAVPSLPRYARGLLSLGALMMAAAYLDKLLLRPADVWPALDLTLSLAGTGGMLFYLYLFWRRTHAAPVTVFQEGAFRGLSSFQESDRARFYGRREDTEALVGMVCRAAFRFGVLYGDSGAGKTSLITAGLMPCLREAGRLPLYCRSHKDPLAALVEECARQTRLQMRPGERQLDYLRRATVVCDTELVVVFDQFEEFFVTFRSSREREPFAFFVAACHGAQDLPVKLLFAIRSDFLHHISAEFDGRVPEPLMGDKRYHLRNFDEERAAEIISLSANASGLPLEAALCRQVAHDLAADGSVLPSELQIVGAQLQTRRIFTLEEYLRAGSKERLAHSYLEDVIRASGDQRAAHLLLRSLISDENTRLALTSRQIAESIQRSQEAVARLLTQFVQSRLIREIQEEGQGHYELMHEYLIEQINQITGKVLNTAQRADRLFKQHLTAYRQDARTRIPLTKLWLIKRHARATHGARGRELLRKSLRRGLLKACALTLLLLTSATLAAALLSAGDEWDDVRLSDGHRAAARRAVFSPDGRLLVSVGEDAKVIVWDFARRQRLATLDAHTAAVTALAFSPDGKWFATGDANSTVIVWDAARWTAVTTLGHHLRYVGGLAFSPDGRMLASTSGADLPPGRTILWAVGSWQKLREWPTGVDYSELLFTPDGRRLMLSTSCSTWDVDTGRRLDDGFNEWGGNWAAFSPGGRRLVGVGMGGSGTVTFSDFTRRKLLARYSVHQDNGRAGAYSPDGRFVVTGAEDIVLWDAKTQTKLARFEYPAIVWSLAFSPDGRWLVSTHGDGAIMLWDVAERRRVADFNEHGAGVRAVAYSRDGKRIVSTGEDRSIIIWDAEHGRKEAVLLGHNTRVTAVALAPDGTWLASCDQDGYVIIWDWARQQPRLTFKRGRTTYSIAISPDGRWLATSHGVYNGADARQVYDYYDSPDYPGCGEPYGQAFSADGRWLAIVTDGGCLHLLETGTWRLLGHAMLANTSLRSLISVSFSPDAKWLVTGGDQGTVHLWAVNPLRKVAVVGQHAARIKSVAFSPDGQQVASAGDDKVIALWDVRRRSLITHIGTHAAPVLSVAFSPDGRQLVAGAQDRSVHVYRRRLSLWGYRLDWLPFFGKR